ncbi:hypothetical protein PGB90_008793 [Kerria lacca]
MTGKKNIPLFVFFVFLALTKITYTAPSYNFSNSEGIISDPFIIIIAGDNSTRVISLGPGPVLLPPNEIPGEDRSNKTG